MTPKQVISILQSELEDAVREANSYKRDAARNSHTALVEEMHANARLMNAAPEMFAALVMMDGLRMLNKCFGDSDGAEIAKDMAVAAIAKATGAQA